MINSMDIGYVVTVLLVIFVSMTLHELMHGLVANWLGDETARLMGRLTLNPLKHVDPFLTIMLPLLIVVTNALTGTSTPIFGGAKPVPFNPMNIRHEEWGIAIMALAGPFVNLLLAFICYAVLMFAGASSPSIVRDILTVGVGVNLGFFAFNILPLPPLDGSRVMYALAPDFIRRGMDTIERYGLLVVLLLILVAGPFLSTYMTAVISGILWVFGRIFGVA